MKVGGVVGIVFAIYIGLVLLVAFFLAYFAQHLFPRLGFWGVFGLSIFFFPVMLFVTIIKLTIRSEKRIEEIPMEPLTDEEIAIREAIGVQNPHMKLA